MKFFLDCMIDMIVYGLFGKVKVFYDFEFDFFDEVIFILGKFKLFIKKLKLEKKVRMVG